MKQPRSSQETQWRQSQITPVIARPSEDRGESMISIIATSITQTKRPFVAWMVGTIVIDWLILSLPTGRIDTHFSVASVLVVDLQSSDCHWLSKNIGRDVYRLGLEWFLTGLPVIVAAVK
jgi:hypothetical protein